MNPSPAAPPRCPLCQASPPPGPRPFAQAHGRGFHQCGECALIFADPAARLDPEEERARYETHENDPADPGYRRFLDRLATPLVDRLSQGAEGLDYGSGPGPTLSVMLEERGMRMTIHDPFFAPDRSVLERRWDFITCTETVEHFFHPDREFEQFRRLLRPGGWLGIMTEWPPGTEEPGAVDRERFRNWYYIRDPTHVCFYTPGTFRWIAREFGWVVDFPRRNVALFRTG